MFSSSDGTSKKNQLQSNYTHCTAELVGLKSLMKFKNNTFPFILREIMLKLFNYRLSLMALTTLADRATVGNNQNSSGDNII